jgi:hypothetical protein
MNFPKRRRRRCPVLKAVQWRSGEHGCHSSLRAVSPPGHAGGFFGDIATKEVREGSWLAGWPFKGALHVRLQLTCGRNSSRRGRGNVGVDQIQNLRRPGALRARAIRTSRSAFVQEPSSHSRMTFKPAVSCFGRKSAIGWHGFARSASTSRAAITTRWNFQMVQSFWSPISQLGKGPRYCNCLQAQWIKRLRRLKLRLDMRLLTSNGLFAVPGVPGPSRFGPP